MKVILLKGVPKVGKPGEIVDVSDGYAANALFPHKLAIPATDKNREALQKKKNAEITTKAYHHELLEKAIASLPDEVLTLSVRANEKGHLFSKITEDDIVKALLAHRVSIAPKNIILGGIIKEVGVHTIVIQEGTYKKEIRLAIVAS